GKLGRCKDLSECRERVVPITGLGFAETILAKLFAEDLYTICKITNGRFLPTTVGRACVPICLEELSDLAHEGKGHCFIAEHQFGDDAISDCLGELSFQPRLELLIEGEV